MGKIPVGGNIREKLLRNKNDTTKEDNVERQRAVVPYIKTKYAENIEYRLPSTRVYVYESYLNSVSGKDFPSVSDLAMAPVSVIP